MKKLRLIVTGATGMVGEGVMHECLLSSDVEEVLVINRRPDGVKHSKLKEIVHKDMYDLTEIEDKMAGYDACFFCLGTTSLGKSKEDYFDITYKLTINFAETVLKKNPQMVFVYVSGAGTDSSEKGKIAWARVKGKTENDLIKMNFKSVYAFRPAFMKPTKGLKHALGFYKYITWLFPLFKIIARNQVSTLAEVGRAMINVVKFGFEKNVMEVPDILKAAKLEK